MRHVVMVAALMPLAACGGSEPGSESSGSETSGEETAGESTGDSGLDNGWALAFDGVDGELNAGAVTDVVGPSFDTVSIASSVVSWSKR